MILFKPAINVTSGLGHLRRCISLAQAMGDKFHTEIVIPFNDKNSIDLIENFDLASLPVDTNLDPSEEVVKYPNSTIAVIIDMADQVNRTQPQYIVDYIKALRSRSIKSIVIDSPTPESLYFDGMPIVEMVIRPYDVQNHNFPNWGDTICSGPKYIIIGQEYNDSAPSSYEKRAENILITFGGSDPQNITETICAFLKNAYSLDNFTFQIILGQSFSNERKMQIEEKYRDDQRFYFYENVPSLKPFFDDALVAIIGSGAASRYEASSCGTPALITAIEPSHNVFIDYHQEYGSSINLGYYKQLKEKIFIQRLYDLIFNLELRLRMNESCCNLDFSGGLARVVKQIEKVVI
jgi:spore coat polysaccharide biosynthesis predicted glycosyltransferase SpsG